MGLSYGPRYRWLGAMGYNARNDEIRDNVTRMQASGKRNAVSWQPCAVSTQRFPPKIMFGSGPRLPPLSR